MGGAKERSELPAGEPNLFKKALLQWFCCSKDASEGNRWRAEMGLNSVQLVRFDELTHTEI